MTDKNAIRNELYEHLYSPQEWGAWESHSPENVRGKVSGYPQCSSDGHRQDRHEGSESRNMAWQVTSSAKRAQSWLMAACGEIRTWLLFTNHFKIRIMKEQILKKIENVIIRVKSKASAESAYNGLINSSPRVFYLLSGIYGLNKEEENFALSAGIA